MTSSSPSPLSVVLAGGGSAGHVSPLLAIAHALRAAEPDAAIVAVGTRDGLETRLVPAAGFALETIERIPMPRRPSVDLLRLPGRMRQAIARGKEILRAADADVLVGVGGYVCTPLYLAAKSLGIPIVIHEANTRAGLANRVGARSAARIGTAFAATVLPRAELVGMPMRTAVATLDRGAARAAARTRLGLRQDQPTLIVTGGSLGALNINRALTGALPALADAGIQTLHLTGAGKAVLAADGTPLTAPGYRQVEYVDAMEDVYAAADLLLCRSGAGTVSEVAAVGLPAVFVPLPVGNGEQARNAAELVAADAAVLVADAALTADWIRTHLIPLCLDAPALTGMGARAATLGRRDAASAMAAMVLDSSRKQPVA